MVEAAYYDGRTSRRQPVRLRAVEGGLDLTGSDWSRREPAASIRVSEPLGGAPRTVWFADGSHCEVAQGAALDGLLAALGHREGAVVRWQRRWDIVAMALVAVVVALAVGYRWGLPWAAAELAPRVPSTIVASLSGRALDLMDRQMLAPSRLPPQRHEAITAGFRRLAAGDPALAGVELLFRHDRRGMGPNAFALPDGRIVLFDSLVELAAGNDEEVLAVLAHELGHVRHRHGLRQLIQSSVVGFVVGAYFGDVSSLLAGLGSILLESRYSREFELEADAHAAGQLPVAGYSAAALATMLEKLERAHRGKEAEGATAGSDVLSSHPDTTERIRRLRGLN